MNLTLIRMAEQDLEQAVEEELEKLSTNLLGSDSDPDIEEEFTAANEKVCVCVRVFVTCSYSVYYTTVCNYSTLIFYNHSCRGIS